MSVKNILHFNNYEKVLVNDNHNIPTVVLTRGKETYIGYQAYENAQSMDEVNINFKVEVGYYDRNNFTKDYQTIKTADNKYISAMKLVELFFNQVLPQTTSYIESNSFSKCKNLMIAEPLSILQKEDIDNRWLANYRRNLKGYFSLKGYENISFLPEPFAVFQYYKYCKKFAPLTSGEQIVALVIDFGGGTFDTCIIETSKEGDIREREEFEASWSFLNS